MPENLAVNVIVDEADLDRLLHMLQAAISSSWDIRQKLQELDRLDGIFKRTYGSSGIELDMHDAPARRAGNCEVIYHPSQRLLEVVSTVRTSHRMQRSEGIV